MMPYSEINIGDWFSNPAYRGYGEFSGLEWLVVDKKDGLVKVQAHKYSNNKPYWKPMWKKPSDRMFSEAWRLERVG